MEPEKKSNGALIGLVIIIIILIIGGIYMWKVNKNTAEEMEAQNNTLSNQDSADLDALEQDLNTADTSIDATAINSVQ
jgi:hypothetical protein